MSIDEIVPVGEGSTNNEVSPLISKADSSASDPLTKYALFVAASLALGSFQFGYHIGELNNPQAVISCDYIPKDTDQSSSLPSCIKMSETTFSFVTSIYILGGLLGNLVAAKLASTFGRKNTLLYNTIFHVVGTLLLGLAYNTTSLFAGRFIVGIGGGISIVVVPMYLTEIAPVAYRGLFGVFHQIGVVGGILVAQTLGLFYSTVPGWRFILSFCLLVSAVQLITFPFIVPSPRYLFSLPNGTEAARAVLCKLRGTDDVDQILLQWEKDDSDSDKENVSFSQLLTRPIYRRPLQILFLLHFTQQFSGINAIMQFSTTILKDTFTADAAKTITVLINVGNLAFTLLSGYLIEKAGRRQLFLISTLLTGLSCATLSFAMYFKYNYLAIVAINMIVVGFAIGLGPIPFVMPTEIFNTRSVATAASVGLIANNIGNFVVTSVYLTLKKWFGPGAFLVFTVYLAIALIISYKVIPETKGKSFEAIIQEWR
ncbi:hypothetical protein K7432_010602 [Basidiobolus ranarum]|uniref:Major facilitator superfamily (MFS) profile domain-containing protein n=1 Tax=Basidiobolus ranarum TaxID=34480 RepID=A0ABR2WNJ2_9FUNG